MIKNLGLSVVLVLALPIGMAAAFWGRPFST
jgi:hypothetical protein